MIDDLYKIKENMPDLQIKMIDYFKNDVYIVNIETVSSSELTNKYILDYFSRRSLLKNKISFLKDDLMNNIPSISFKEIEYDELFNYLFNGFTSLIYGKTILVFETKANLDRGINEPSSEPTINGPKDSFNENYNTNIGLVRKRIKDKNLYLKEFILGSYTNTKVCIMYMDNIVDKDLLINVINKIKNIKSNKILDTYYIKELIKKENKTSFPTIKSSEKPDVIAKCLTEGRICILSENSNNVLIIPTFFLDFFYNSEDNYHKKFFSIFSKVIRLIAFFITIFTPAIYLSLITYDEQMLPTDLLINFSIQRSSVPFPAIIEILILMITFEILYEADAQTPTSRGTSLSILGALILGQAAVDAGIVSPITVIVVALSAVSSILFVYYDFQSFVRIYRYLLLILANFFGIIGILFGFIFLITNLCKIKCFDKPFMINVSSFFDYDKKMLIKKSLMIQNTNKGDL